MDNDAAGEKARDVLAAGLSEMGFTYSIANISGDAKDPNEALQKDRDALGLAIYDAMRDTRPDSTSRYIDRFMQKDVEKNIVYVSKNLNDENLWTKELHLKDVLLRTNISISFVSSLAPVGTGLASSSAPVVADAHEIDILVRLRHRAALIPARFDGETLYFKDKIKRPASGQSAVLYAVIIPITVTT